MFTSHCDLSHCFEEVSSGQLKTKVHGDFLPTHFLGKFAIVFAFLRQLYLVLVLIVTGTLKSSDVLFADQLSYCLPLIYLFKGPKTKVIFYCHFPDKLLASHSGFARRVYRAVFDTIEEFSMGFADKILVNSNFTKKTASSAFKSLKPESLDVLYPCVGDIRLNQSSVDEVSEFFKEEPFFLSVNRFERKKNISLAIRKYHEFICNTKSNHKLVIAGGYDARVFENVDYLIELESLCKHLKLSSITIRGKLIVAPRNTQVFFLPSISTDLKNALIKNAQMLVYTPSFEHFGIVPVEAMKLGTPVLAEATGGPTETVVPYDNKDFTGYLVGPTEDRWVEYLNHVESLSATEKRQLALRAQQRAQSLFSFEAMAQSLNHAIEHCTPATVNFTALLYLSILLGLVVPIKFAIDR
ncbi:hypothetical protein OGAPHI_001458 [Ogataea philodendri]|uniref:Alpha-1,3/1,6-mannosyltransferase ALG2 n=1 Tax=Ogataea philodendri TaxID=1378263 RepID=A0A9P8PCH7_9ASCO|nr:uncharacterized protein OGAPHI_001458 [Ogataea philodendri]KAH3669337.1 hypothetical protein OGAPHI_001458 [Ogataea philodendri]